MSVSENLKRRRKERHWTQADLAKKSGVSQQAISFIESERNTPSEGTLRLLSKALGCSVSDLIEDAVGQKKELGEAESRLLEIFAQLNEAGQAAILASAEALLELPAMRKEGFTSSMA